MVASAVAKETVTEGPQSLAGSDELGAHTCRAHLGILALGAEVATGPGLWRICSEMLLQETVPLSELTSGTKYLALR